MLKKMWTMLCVTLISSLSFAQTTKMVTGTITDAVSGESLIGVNIMIEGSATGTTTDLDGKYSLNVPENAVLVVSYIGYETIKESVKGRTVIDVKLGAKSEVMDEVVVVGYTTMKKADVLGAVSKVGTKELTAAPLASAEQALQGRIAGVQVSAATGAPGADISVRVRGVGSIYSDNAPLYIVDGIPSSEGLNNISPNDIENVTVLKDASSAAIYGSRATNGVILITTKQGKSGKARISYNGTVGVQNAVNLVKMANTKEYVELYNEATAADNIGTSIQRSFITDDMLGNLANVNHVDEIFRTAMMHSHELSVSGGNDNVSYLVSGSYFNQDGIIRNSGYERGTLRANLNAKAKEWLHIGMNMNGSIANTKSVSSSGDGYGNNQGGSVVRYAMFRNPAIPVKDANGNYIDKPSTYFGNAIYDTFFGDGYNPEALADYTDRNKNNKTLFAKVNAKILLPFNLNLNTNFGVDYRSFEEKVYNRSWGDNNRINNPNSLTIANEEDLNWTFNTTLNFNRKFNDAHTVSALVGFEAIRETAKTANNSDQDFSIWDKNLIYIGNGNGKRESSQSEWASTLASFFLQANYDYKSRYYINATLREDGTSRFIGDNRWGTFYSVSGGWNIRNEAFMADQEIFHQLKLRAGYGVIGNQNVGLYAYSDRYSPNYYYPFGGVAANGYAQTQLGNENLKWETSEQFNVGLDMEFLKGALGFSVDFYNKITDNMLMQAPYPPSIGNASSPWINSGKVLNRGVDFEAVYHHIFKDGRFDIAFNGGFLHNEVLEIDAPVVGGRVDNGVYATKTEVGYPVGSFFMYEMDGIFQDEYEIISSAYQGAGIKPGDVKFKDIHKDGTIDSKDRKHVGSSIPKFTLGLNLSAEWKGFDISAFFQGAYGHKIYNQILTDNEGFYRGFNVTKRYYDNRWTETNPSNEYPRASWKAKSNNARVSTRFLENASYTRLKNLQIGYTFKTNQWKVDRLRIYLAATNLFTLTKYSGFDPEMTVSANSSGEGDRANGIDWGTYPACRTYTFGVNLTF
ncbi:MULTISPECIES: TonB-dependent receptor [unclassified Bacteroides]|jgi:TonB-linked SusC/RagA family outer membrane protein|uniref:SusC/RagA family TonB-linked outer membrane protein n=1 Tax=unclassified Bacteroides TaxID=2646097 RepID=UPI000E813D86|nr:MULTISPECIES: TonB-dependent receptor [unclassified Bacteroides]RGN46333.1 TonB-dependent receptor [Bacteroides sp. OM05-12]RHR74773.1 TonB-dependent receptor [Bacteroides sp. AF16-49]